jgi:hypothetical protein
MHRKYLIYFFLLLQQFSFAQEININISSNEKALKEVIEYLEKKYNLRFSYQDETIYEKKVTLNIKNGDLKELLSQLEKQTHLDVELASNRYIIIKKKESASICGYVLDHSTNLGIAEVLIKSTANANLIYTNEEGYFSIENVSESDVISIAHSSYFEQKIGVSSFISGDCKKITVELAAKILNEVIIPEYLGQGIARNNNGAIILNQRKLRILPGITEPDVLENLQWIPGVMSTSESVSDLNIRGGKSDQNLILWDGMTVYQSDHFFGMLSALNPYVTKKTTLFRNGAPVQYGNRVSGIIDIQTENEIPKKGSGGMGFNMTHADMYGAIPVVKDKLGIIVSARRSFTDVIPTFTYKSLSKKVFQNTHILDTKNEFDEEYTELTNKFYFLDFHFKSIWKPTETNKIVFNFLTIKNDLKYNSVTIKDTITNKELLGTSNKNLGIAWQKKWNSVLEQETKIYFTDYNGEYRHNLKYDELTTDVFKKNSVTELGIHLKFNYKISEQQFLSFGGQHTHNKVIYKLKDSYSGIYVYDNEFYDSSHSKIYSAFTEYKLIREKNIFITIGLRMNQFSINKKINFEPRINIEKQLNPYFRAKLSGEIRSQAISQFLELNEDDLEMSNQVWALSNNEGIPIVNAQQIGTGILFSNNGWDIDVDTYLKKTNNLSLLYQKSTPTIVYQTNGYHFGSGLSQGIDVLIKKKIRNYNTWIGYTLSQTDYLFESIQNENFRADTNAKHNFRWSNTYKWNDLEFALGTIWRSGTPYSQAINIATNTIDGLDYLDLEYNKINTSLLPNYTRVDFSTAYHFYYSKNKRLRSKIGVSFLNIFNQKNIINRNYKIIYDTNPYIERVDKLALGFTANMVFRMEW